jgi:hypothetical protein
LTLATPTVTQATLADLLSCGGGYDSHLRRIRRALLRRSTRMTRAIDHRADCPSGLGAFHCCFAFSLQLLGLPAVVFEKAPTYHRLGLSNGDRASARRHSS